MATVGVKGLNYRVCLFVEGVLALFLQAEKHEHIDECASPETAISVGCVAAVVDTSKEVTELNSVLQSLVT